MKILLVEPHLGIKNPWLYQFVYFKSLALEQIAALTPQNHDIDIIVETFEKIDYSKDYDLIGISCLTCNALRGYEIADEFIRRGKKVVLGGYHPSALPYEAKQHADSVVIGEAELIWPLLLKDVENNKLKQFYQSKKFVNPSNIPAPRRLKSGKSEYISIQASRGCPYKCKFCSMQNIEGTLFRPRPIKNIIDEICEINNKNLFFADSSLTLNPEYTKLLFKEMKDYNKIFQCFGNINVLGDDYDLLRISHDAGCIRWLIGIESISQLTINNINKRSNIVKKYHTAIKNIKDHGMMVTGLFMFGFDTDKPDVFEKTLEAMDKWDLDSISCSILTPYPGTAIFKQLKKEKRIKSYDWSKYTEGRVNYIPKNFSEQELKDGVRNVISKFYSYPRILKRIIRSNNLDPYIFYRKILGNLLIKEIFYKELMVD
ncbi:hypothetical protein AYK24_07215 [Thermoplasmatales archaeon SG8-52-4]|nr:MAG: hypothetical protein AYK24_07215 [Thermoplasmatales archaeon SG8-52-4]